MVDSAFGADMRLNLTNDLTHIGNGIRDGFYFCEVLGNLSLFLEEQISLGEDH